MPARLRPLALLAVIAAGVAGVITAPPALADTAPHGTTPATVSTDSLPAPQINGVVWSQVVIGDTVYAAGRFSRARPSGVPLKSHGHLTGVVRGNMLAYNITTGDLITDFAPRFNSEVRALAASPDGSTVYAVGNFTAVDGKRHTRVAAIDAVTGHVAPFSGSLNAEAYAVAVHGDTVYTGGRFTSASGHRRIRLAAFTSRGKLKAWAPSANRAVQGIAVSPTGGSVVVGGHFSRINGHAADGSARVNSGSGRSNLAWAINKLVQNSGPDAAIWSVTAGGSYVYLSGYSYHPLTIEKRLEGVVSATWSGHLHWIEDCHGDTYDTAPIGDVVYTASHAHDCTTMGAFHQSKPVRYNHTLAFTVAATGHLKRQTKKQYTNYGGKPSPTMLDWFPSWKIGHFTGQDQAVWTVTGDSRYLVYGGEFLAVNGNRQQGLARFAVSSLAPDKDGPRLSGKEWTPTLKALGGGKVRITFKADFDRDNEYLTTEVVRYLDAPADACTMTTRSRYYFDRPTYTCTDSGLTPGTQVAYRLKATDPFGNSASGSTRHITVK